MTRIIQIHPENPQPRLISQVIACIQGGGVVAYPTDSSYALGCHIGDKSAIDRIRAIRRLSPQHHFTLICRDLSELATYARVENAAFRILKKHTPGPYTFIFKATQEVPRRLQHPKRKTIGIRVPDFPIVREMLDVLAEPMINTSLILPGEEKALTDAEMIEQKIGHELDIIVDGGYCASETSSVIDLLEDTPKVIRKGKGDVSLF